MAAPGDARAIYAQFASTPLKIRTTRTAAVDAPASSEPVPHDAATTEKGDVVPHSCSPPAAAALVSPSGPSPPLRASKRVASAKKQQQQRKASADDAEHLHTPTEDVRPSKRRKKAATATGSATKKPRAASGSAEAVRAPAPADESRSLLSAFVLCDREGETEEEEKAEEKTEGLTTPPKLAIPAMKRRPQAHAEPLAASAAARSPTHATNAARLTAEAPLDYITKACDSLLKTETICGALFSVALNSLRFLQDEFAQQCEQLAEAPNRSSAKPPSLLSRRRGLKSSAGRKSVRFQSFDLSCLDLQYVRNARTEGIVDKILYSYDDMMRQVAPVLRSFDGAESGRSASAGAALEARILRELVRILSDDAMLSVDPEALSTEAEQIYLAAYGLRDSHAQHELQASRTYYAKEFRKLVLQPSSDTSSSASFLEELFSSLVSSSVRFKLRALFLEYDAAESAAQDAPPANMAVYAHQDFGSAVHCALQESLLYEPLVAPVLALVNHTPRLMAHFETVEMDDFEHIEQYALARRFLAYHLRRAYEAPSPDGFSTTTWAKIERICGIAKRHHFDDEAHLFPLESVKSFIKVLMKEEADLARLEAALGEFYDQKKECGEVVTRLEPSGFIVCISCAGNFHLECLHLPPSFTQFAGQYTCPSCFLGRR
ncbi:hypothetical protein PybrP1_005530 [[Pythium] brassicae (nom. inval.)]|nr:hypothetical protein PybrP1_005530 [[Pythium] brassicae (nom. inval.)]